MHKFPHELTNGLRLYDLRILGEEKISEKSVKYLDLMASTHPDCQKGNFDIYAKKSPNISYKKLHTKTCFT